jgi:hypothetical protein
MSCFNNVFRVFIISVLSVLFLTACPEDQNDPHQQSSTESLFDGIDSKVIYSHGPLKKMMPEQYLAALSDISGFDYGSYDFITQDNQGSFQGFCERLGGCPDHVTRFRSDDVGMVQTMTMDEIANLACFRGADEFILPPGINSNDTNPTPQEIRDAIIWQYRRITGSSPDSLSELLISEEYFRTHLGKIVVDTQNQLTTDEGDRRYNFETALRSHCFAIVTSSKFIYY